MAQMRHEHALERVIALETLTAALGVQTEGKTTGDIFAAATKIRNDPTIDFPLVFVEDVFRLEDSPAKVKSPVVKKKKARR